jgi:hypothetical protein
MNVALFMFSVIGASAAIAFGVYWLALFSLPLIISSRKDTTGDVL